MKEVTEVLTYQFTFVYKDVPDSDATEMEKMSHDEELIRKLADYAKRITGADDAAIVKSKLFIREVETDERRSN